MSITSFLLLLLISVCLSERIMRDLEFEGDALLGKSVSIACDGYYIASAPGVNSVVVSNEGNDTVIAAPKNATFFGGAMSAHCKGGLPFIVVSAPGQYLAFYYQDFVKPVKVLEIGQGEGYTVASNGDFVVYSGDKDAVADASINLININTWSVKKIFVGTTVKRNYAFSLALNAVSNSTVNILVGSPGQRLNMTLNGTSGLVSMLNAKLNGNDWKIEQVYSEIKDVLFGTSVAFSSDGTFAVIGSPQLYNHTNRHNERPQGQVYFLSDQEKGWKITGSLLGSDHIFFDLFGLTVALPENGTNVLSVGALNFRGQFRVFIFKKSSGNTTWELFNHQDSMLSIHAYEPSGWVNSTFYESKNFSMALNENFVFAGVTLYSDKIQLTSQGLAELISTNEIPLPNWGVALIGMSALFVVGFIAGIIYFFADQKDRRNRAYKEVI